MNCPPREPRPRALGVVSLAALCAVVWLACEQRQDTGTPFPTGGDPVGGVTPATGSDEDSDASKRRDGGVPGGGGTADAGSGGAVDAGSSGGGSTPDGGVAEPSYGRILWVSPTGSDTAAGTEVAPYRTIARALTMVGPGEAVFLKTGTWSERILVSSQQDGLPGAYITVRAAPGATPVLKGGTGSTQAMIDVRRAYWRFEGLTVDLAGDRAFGAIWRTAAGHHGVLRGSVLKNGTAGAGVTVAEFAHDVLIEGNDISYFTKVEDDSHGVLAQTSASNVTVRGNDIHHNSGDSVQCIGPEGGATMAGTPFDNLLVEDNLLHDNRENGIDIKTCTRVTLQRNRVYGHKLSTTSRGEGIVVHLSARDVIVDGNTLWGNGKSIAVGGVRVNDPPTNIVVTRNVVRDGINANGEEGVGIRVGTSVNVKVTHNTVWNMPGACVFFAGGDSGPTENIEVRNNVLGTCAVHLRVGSERGTTALDYNQYFQPGGSPVLRLDGTDRTLSAWKTATGWDAHSLEGSPLFVDLDAKDFRLAPTSPARNAGATWGQAYCDAAPDLGAVESDCP